MDFWFTGTAFAQMERTGYSLGAADETIRSFLRTIDEAFSARTDLFVLPSTLSLHHWYEEMATMIRSTATKYFGQHTETARAGWMTADAWTDIQHRQHVIKQHIPLIASGRASHPFKLKLLRIWRSMVSVFRADREVVKACKEARRAHREALANDLDMALGTCETTMGDKMITDRRFLFRPPISVKITGILQKTPEFREIAIMIFLSELILAFFFGVKQRIGGYERGEERKEKREERRRGGLRCDVLSRAVLSCAVDIYIYIYIYIYKYLFTVRRL